MEILEDITTAERRRSSTARFLSALCCGLCLISGRSSAQQGELPLPERTSRLMPLVAYELGTPQTIQRAPGVVNRGEFGADGSGRSLDNTAIFGIEFLFPRLVDDAFGLGMQFSLAQSDGWFESDTFLDTTSAVDRLYGTPLVSTNMFDVESSETQMRVTLLGTWDLSGLRLAAGPWAGYRVTSRLVQTEQIVDPVPAIFESNGQKERIVGSDSPLESFRWRFGGSARISHDFFLSSTFALAPFLTTRFDGESLFSKGLGFRAFSIGAGLGFSVTWRPDPVERIQALLKIEREPATPRFALHPAGRSLATAAIVEDTVIIGEVHTSQSDLIGIPERWSVSIFNEPLIVDLANVPTPESLSTRPLDEVLVNIPTLLARRMWNDPELSLRIVPQQGEETGDDGNDAERGAEMLYNFMTQTVGVAPEQVSIGQTDTTPGEKSTLLLISSSPDLLDPILLRRTVVELQAPDLAIAREDPGRSIVDSGGAWHFTIRRDDRVVGEYDSGEGSVAIGRQDFRKEGGVISLVASRKDGGRSTEAVGDTLYYRMRPTERRNQMRWVLPGQSPRERGATTYRAFLHLVAAAAGENPDRVITISVAGDEGVDRSTILSDLLDLTGHDYTGTIIIRQLPENHPLAVGPWGGGIVLEVQ